MMQRCRIFAHRGANREAMENTAAAFDRALQCGVDGFETDVQLSADGVAVLWHDRLLDRVGLAGRRVGEVDFAQLQGLDFSRHLPPGQERLLDFGSFLQCYRARVQLLIEIKNRRWERERNRHQPLVRELLAQLQKQSGNSGPDLFVSSFDPGVLHYAHRCAPAWPPLILNDESFDSAADLSERLAAQPFLAGLCLPIDRLDAELVATLRQMDKLVATYTCNSAREIGKALALGVDVLITDTPRLALQMRSPCNAISTP